MGKGKNSFNFINEESDLKVENYQPTSQMWHPIVPHALSQLPLEHPSAISGQSLLPNGKRNCGTLIIPPDFLFL